MEKKKFSYAKVLKDTLTALVISSILFIPIVGVKLTAWTYKVAPLQTAVLVLLVVLVRFLSSIVVQIPTLKSLALRIFGQKIHEPVVEGETKTKFQKYGWLFFLVFAFIPLLAGQYWLSVWITAMIYVLLGLGLNIVIGFAGLLDLGYVAFYAVGAYTVALLHQFFGFGFWESLPFAVGFAGLFGTVLAFPVLRMHGDYLAIVTLGFGEIIRIALNNWTFLTNGPNGIRLPKPFLTFFGLNLRENDPNSFFSFFGLSYSETFRSSFTFYLLLVAVIAVAYFCFRLKAMPLGRTWEAIREDEVACRSLGINVVKTKLAAFSLGAAIGGLGGSFFVVLTEFVSPSSFSFIESALVVAIVVLGGLGSIPGSIIAAIVLTMIPEVLREFADIRILVFGMIMVVMMIWRPRGLARIIRPRLTLK